MNEWAINIFDSLEKIGIATPIVVMLLAALPIAEARIALPPLLFILFSVRPQPHYYFAPVFYR